MTSPPFKTIPHSHFSVRLKFWYAFLLVAMSLIAIVYVLGFGFWVLGFGFWVLGFGSVAHNPKPTTHNPKPHINFTYNVKNNGIVKTLAIFVKNNPWLMKS